MPTPNLFRRLMSSAFNRTPTSTIRKRVGPLSQVIERLDHRIVPALINFTETTDLVNPPGAPETFTVDTAGANVWSGTLHPTAPTEQDTLVINLAPGIQITQVQFQYTDVAPVSDNWFISESTGAGWGHQLTSGGSVNLTNTGFNMGNPTLPITSTLNILLNGSFIATNAGNWVLTLTAAASAVPPSVTSNPTNQSVTAGQTANFSAAASGSPTPTIQWQEKIGAAAFANISDGTVGGVTYSGTTTGTLSVTPSSTAASGRLYRAVFTNTAGTANSNSATMTVTVNNAPAGTDKTVAATEDTAFTFAATDFGFTDPNDTPANSLNAVRIATLPGTGTLTNNGVAVTAGNFVSVADITGNKLKFTPALNGNGSPYTTFTFQVQDNGGTTGGGVDLDPSANTITINVAPLNDAPAGTDKTVTATEDTAFTFAATDFGFTDPNDTPPNSLNAVRITTLPGAGTLTNNGVAVTAGQSIPVTDITGNKLKFTPALDGNGSPYTTFTFQVQDNGGTTGGGVDLDQSPNTMTLNVTAVSDITNDSLTTNEDAAITANVITGTNGATADTFENAGAAITSVTQGTNGAVTFLAGGAVTYTPVADFNGSDSFTYTVTSGGKTETATVNVTINAVADITNDALTTNEDAAITANVITGTNGATADTFENAGAAITSVTQGTNGTVTFLAAGNVTYTPIADFNGTDSFTYTVTSGGKTETATVNVTITAVSDITNDSLTTNEDAAITANVITGTNGATADTFENAGAAITSVTQGTNGTVTFLAAGNVTYTPTTADFNGTDSFTYTVTSSGNTETATVNVTINSVPDFLSPNSTTFTGGNPGTFTVITDDPTAALTFTGTLPAGVSFTDNGNGTATIAGTPTAISGSFTITITANNGVAPGVTQTFTLAIATPQFDFQPSASSPLQAGSVAVLPGTNYTAARGFGWTKTPWRTNDAGPVPSLAGNPLAFQLRDYMSDFGGLSSAGIFRVDFASADPVQITTFLGDASGALDGIEVAYSTNGTTYTPFTPGGGLTIPAGKFTSVTSPAVIPGVVGETRSVWIRIQDLAGSTSNWSASGLAVRAVGSVGALGVTPSEGSVPADGLTVDTYTVTGAAPGAVLNITASLGTILTDARTELLGNQVIADGAGMATFQVRRPFVNGNSTITVSDFTGAATRTITQTYDLVTNRKFDMNASVPSLPDASWLDVRTTSLYSAAAGYGWTTAPSAADLGTYPAGSTAAQQALYRDYHSGTGTNTFKVYVGAFCTVNVKIYTYTPSLGISGMTVSLEGGAFQPVSGNSTTFTATAGADGILDITFKAATFSNWATNGIELS